MPENGETVIELSESQKIAIRKSWAAASQPNVHAGTKLFKVLFQLAPEAASYFSNTGIDSEDFQQHIGLVMGTLDTAVNNLDTLSDLIPSLQELGATHAAFGVKKEYFNFVKVALLTTLSQELQDSFTDECRMAWALAFDILAGAMRSGM